MATVQTAIVDRALRIVLGVETSGTATQSSLALTALNAMIDSWRNEGLMASSVTELSAIMVVGVSSYTLGAAGTFSTTRPLAVLDAYMRQYNVDTKVNLLTFEEWDALQYKIAQSNIVTDVFYNPVFPVAELKVYPVPKSANILVLIARTDLTGFTALSDIVSLPAGWERALAYNLAIEIAPEYGTIPNQAVVKSANDSKTAIKHTNNLAPIRMVAENMSLFKRTRTNIISGV